MEILLLPLLLGIVVGIITFIVVAGGQIIWGLGQLACAMVLGVLSALHEVVTVLMPAVWNRFRELVWSCVGH